MIYIGTAQILCFSLNFNPLIVIFHESCLQQFYCEFSMVIFYFLFSVFIDAHSSVRERCNIPLSYLFNHLFVSAWNHGYVFFLSVIIQFNSHLLCCSNCSSSCCFVNLALAYFSTSNHFLSSCPKSYYIYLIKQSLSSNDISSCSVNVYILIACLSFVLLFLLLLLLHML